MCSREDDPNYRDTETVAEAMTRHLCMNIWNGSSAGRYICNLPRGHVEAHRDNVTETPITYVWANVDQAHPAQQAHRSAHV